MTEQGGGCLGRISLIVCTIGRHIELENLLRSLTRQTFTNFEVVVVDSNPAGFLEPLIEGFRERLAIKHVYCERGLSRARNVGLRTLNGQFVAFPDDDCWYEERTLETVAGLFCHNPHLDMITGRTIDPAGRASVSNFLDAATNITKLNVFSCGNSASMFFRSRVVDRVKSFDERLGIGAQTPFQSGDETDFILRVLAHGYRARFFPELQVFHPQVVDEVTITPEQLARARGYGAGFGATLRKHGYPKIYVAYRIARPALSCLKALVCLRLSLAAYRFAWGCSLLRGYFAWQRYKRIDIRLPTVDAPQVAKLP
jgi:glycosyltransferase involved in cell wall biosynthesis